MRFLKVCVLWGVLGPAACLVSMPACADPAHDLVGKTYQVETTASGAVNVAIDFNRVGYGVVSPSRMVPAGGDLPGYRIETLADGRGSTIVMAARLQAHLTDTVDEWLVTAAIPAPKVSSDSNMTYACPGNTDAAPVVQLVYYDGEGRGRTIRKIAAGFALDRRSGQLTDVAKPPQNCKATESPL
jgi:hypothetical protein